MKSKSEFKGGFNVQKLIIFLISFMRKYERSRKEKEMIKKNEEKGFTL